MKPRFLLLFGLTALVVSSCSVAYQTGQTPDDVYFSPGKPVDEYVRVDKRDNNYYQGQDTYNEDRFLRMRVRDRYRWSYLDDYYFYNRPGYYGYGYYGYSGWNLNSPWNSYWYWNNFYNPYCRNVYVVYTGNAKTSQLYRKPVSRPVVFNPASYTISNSSGRVRYSSYMGSYNNSNTRYNNSNSSGNNSLGNSIRKVFSGSGNSSSNNTYTPSRSYTPSSSSGSSSGGSSSGGSSGGGVKRPTRGGG